MGQLPKFNTENDDTEQILFLLGLQILEGASKDFWNIEANFFADIASV